MPDDESFDQEFDDLLRDRFILGSPGECYEQLRPYFEELGVNHLVFRTHWAGMPLPVALSSMRLISDELLPALKKRRGFDCRTDTGIDVHDTGAA